MSPLTSGTTMPEMMAPTPRLFNAVAAQLDPLVVDGAHERPLVCMVARALKCGELYIHPRFGRSGHHARP